MKLLKSTIADRTTYAVESETGRGRMERYSVFPGIKLLDDISIDLCMLRQKLCDGGDCFYRSANQTIEHIFFQHITVEALILKFDVGRTLFLNCFKAVYGLSIYAYMKESRMNGAAVLLNQSSQDIAVIADAFGCQSANKFARAFREVFGLLPSEYRKTTGQVPFRTV